MVAFSKLCGGTRKQKSKNMDFDYDFEREEMLDRFMHEYPEEYAEYTGTPLKDVYAELEREREMKEKYKDMPDDLPFESINQRKLDKIVSESIRKVLNSRLKG